MPAQAPEAQGMSWQNVTKNVGLRVATSNLEGLSQANKQNKTLFIINRKEPFPLQDNRLLEYAYLSSIPRRREPL